MGLGTPSHKKIDVLQDMFLIFRCVGVRCSCNIVLPLLEMNAMNHK